MNVMAYLEHQADCIKMSIYGRIELDAKVIQSHLSYRRRC